MKTGFNPQLEKDHSEDADYTDQKFGAALPTCLALIPEDKRLDYLPQGESQNLGEDKINCASRSPIEYIETKLNWLYKNGKLTLNEVRFFIDNGYVQEEKIKLSDAYPAILSGTTREGNSLKAPCQAIHEWGIVPKKLLPQLDTWEADNDPARITSEIKMLGLKSLQFFNFNYHKVYNIDYSIDFYVLAGFAWPNPVNGEYPRVDYPFNHAFLGVKNPKHIIRDSYPDTVDGDYIKKLAADYKLLDYQYRIYISRAEKKSLSFLRRLGEAIKNWWNEIIK